MEETYRIQKKKRMLSYAWNLFQEMVGILTAKREITGVLIENEEIAEAQRIIFDLLWKLAKSC